MNDNETVEQVCDWLTDRDIPFAVSIAEVKLANPDYDKEACMIAALKKLAYRILAAHKNGLRRQCEYLDKRYEQHMESLIERHDAITDNLRKLIDPTTSKNADFVEAMNIVTSFADRAGVSLRDSDGSFTTKHLEDLFDSLLRLRRAVQIQTMNAETKTVNASRMSGARHLPRPQEKFESRN